MTTSLDEARRYLNIAADDLAAHVFDLRAAAADQGAERDARGDLDQRDLGEHALRPRVPRQPTGRILGSSRG